MQRISQETVLAMRQWVVERWPTAHNNSAPEMGTTKNWAHQGALLRTNPRCGTCWGMLQAEGREGGLGQDGGGTGTRVSVAEELETAGGSWEAVLLATLSQLSKLLAMCTGGAAGTWKQLRRRREVRQDRRGGRGGRAVQQWRRKLRSYVHQQRCGRVANNVEAGVEEPHGEAV